MLLLILYFHPMLNSSDRNLFLPAFELTQGVFISWTRMMLVCAIYCLISYTVKVPAVLQMAWHTN